MTNEKNLQKNMMAIFQKFNGKKSNDIGNDYQSLSDTFASKDLLDNTMHMLVPMQRSVIDNIALVQKARTILQQYLKIKNFILDVHAPSVAKDAGIESPQEVQKFITKIASEMEETLKEVAHLSAKVAHEKSGALDKQIAYNELKALCDDLNYRLASYQRHHQSYLLDDNMVAEVLFEKKTEDA